MKIIGIIPSRYHSTRFPGKALAMLAGRPLLCHVCEAAIGSGCLDEVLVATDSAAILEVCQAHGFTAVMTSAEHRTPTARVKEVSDSYPADLYVMIGGDEPLLSPDDIRLVVKQALRQMQSPDAPTVVNASGIMTEPTEVLDPSNIKLVCRKDGEGLYASRSPIPYPKGTLDCLYRKFVSIGVYTKEALDFFASTPPGSLERIEEFDLLRFMEHRRRVYFVDITRRTLSVDTPADLARAEALMSTRTSMELMNQPFKRYKGVIFDLDGTLLDTAEGVLASVRYTTEAMGYPPLSDEVMRTFIGPPVKRSLIATYQLDEAEAERATEVFRNRYKDYDLLKASPYEGIMALLKELKQQGYLVGVATLKRDDYAHTLLEHFGIDRYCDAICGSDFASKMLKIDVLNNCLSELGLSAGEAVLVGDTSSDGIGAEAAGVDLLAVTYGFGYRTAQEWSLYHPVFTADNVKQIGTFLGIEVNYL